MQLTLTGAMVEPPKAPAGTPGCPYPHATWLASGHCDGGRYQLLSHNAKALSGTPLRDMGPTFCCVVVTKQSLQLVSHELRPYRDRMTSHAVYNFNPDRMLSQNLLAPVGFEPTTSRL